jgi:hypothetical protein
MGKRSQLWYPTNLPSYINFPKYIFRPKSPIPEQGEPSKKKSPDSRTLPSWMTGSNAEYKSGGGGVNWDNQTHLHPVVRKKYKEIDEEERKKSTETETEKSKNVDRKRKSCHPASDDEKCYIIDPNHFNEEAHKGDPDYVPQTEV